MTHDERVLQLLSDRKPHTHHEIYALHVIGHSRISSLRAKGYQIEQWRDGDDYLYQLTATPGAESPRGAADSLETTPAGNHAPAAVSLSAPGAGAATAKAPDFIEGQLSLEDVAA